MTPISGKLDKMTRQLMDNLTAWRIAAMEGLSREDQLACTLVVRMGENEEWFELRGERIAHWQLKWEGTTGLVTAKVGK